jgi:hypothetical protein
MPPKRSSKKSSQLKDPSTYIKVEGGKTYEEFGSKVCEDCLSSFGKRMKDSNNLDVDG